MIRSLLLAKIALVSFSACYQAYPFEEPGIMEVLCLPEEMGILPGDELELEAELSRPLEEGERGGWRYVGVSDGATSFEEMDDPLKLRVKGERGGVGVFWFETIDAAGRSERCESRVVVVSGPPFVACPLEGEAFPIGKALDLRPIVVEDIGVAEASFELLRGPEGAELSAHAGESLRFTPQIEGDYQIRFTVRDVEGFTASCDYELFAAAPPKLSCPDEITIYRDEATEAGKVIIEGRPLEKFWLSSSELSAGDWSYSAEMDGELTLEIAQRGLYTIRAHARDELGLEGSCEFDARVIQREPWVECPAQLQGKPLESISFSGWAGDDDGEIVELRWELIDAPDGSTAELGAIAPAAALDLDLVGVYRAEFIARDDDGHESRCTTRIIADAPPGLYIELVWDTDSDFDLYLLHPSATAWGSSSSPPFLQCSWRTWCFDGPIAWFSPSEDDDPRLLADNFVGFGPEVIYIPKPHPGSYAVGVHSHSNHRSPRTANFEGNARLLIHCNTGSRRRLIRLGPTSLAEDLFWRAAEIIIGPDGECLVEQIVGLNGRPPDVCEAYIAYGLRTGYVFPSGSSGR